MLESKVKRRFPLPSFKFLVIFLASAVFAAGAFFILGGPALMVEMTDRALRASIPRIERTASEALGAPVKFLAVRPKWRGFRPGLEVEGFQVLTSAAGGDPAVSVSKAQLEIDGLRSLLTLQLHFGRVSVEGVRLTAAETEGGKWKVKGLGNGSGDFPAIALDVTFTDAKVAIEHAASGHGQIRFGEGSVKLAGFESIALNVNDVRVEDDVLLEESLQLASLEAKIRKTATGWEVGGAQLRADGLTLNSEVRWGEKSRILIELKDSDLRKVLKSVPRPVVPAAVRNWLLRAVEGGRAVTLELLLEGTPESWSKFQGIDLAADVRDLTFGYADGWPKLQKAQGKIGLKQGLLSFELQQAQADQMRLSRANGKLSGLGSGKTPQLALTTQIDAKADSLLRFMTAGPLRQQSAPWVELAFPTAPLSAQVEISFPIDRARLSQEMKLAVELVDAGFQHPDTELEVRELNGRISLAEGLLTVSSLSGKLGGRELSVNGTHRLGASSEFKLTGEVPAASLHSLLKKSGQVGMVDRISGSAPVQIDYLATYRGEGLAEATMKLRSDLKGLALNLPAPLAKDAGAALPVSATAVWVKKNLDRWKVETEGENGSKAVASAEFKRAHPRSSLKASVKAPRLDGSGWSDFLRAGGSGKKVTVEGEKDSTAPLGAKGSAPQDLNARLETDELIWRDLIFRKFGLSATSDSKGDRGEFESEEAVGTFDHQAAAKLLKVDLQKLVLARLPGAGGAAAADPSKMKVAAVDAQPSATGTFVPEDSAMDLRGWPSLSVRCARCEIGEWNWGTVKFDARQAGDRMVLEQFSASSPRLELVVEKGQSAYSPAKSELSGRLKFLKDFTYRFKPKDAGAPPTVLHADRGLARFSVSWPGGPEQFALAKAEGSLQGYICEGKFDGVQESGSFITKPLKKWLLNIRSNKVGAEMNYELASFDMRLIDGKLVSNFIRALFGNVFVKIEGRSDLVAQTLDFPGYGVVARGLPDPPLSIAGGSRCFEEPEDGDYDFEAEPKTIFPDRFHIKGTWTDPKFD